MNKPPFKSALVILLCITILSCSTNENNDENPDEGSFFSPPHAYIYDENIVDDHESDLAIMLSNKDLLPDNISSGINILYVDYRGVDFDSGEKELYNYRITENASRVNGYIQGGTRLLEDNYNSDLNASQISFTINSISSTNISFTYSFTRLDGEIFSGNYSGAYINLNE